MTGPARPHTAFAALRRALLVRRVRRLDAVVRVEIAALALLVGGFVFWQTRVPLAGLARTVGPDAAALRLATGLLLLAIAAATDAGMRHARRLREGVPGPEWLALPLDPATLEHHLAWEAGMPSWIVLLPAGAAILAAAGVLPAWALPVAGLVFVAVAGALGRVAMGLAFAMAPAREDRRRGADRITACLASARRDGQDLRRPPARWRRAPAWLALWRKDLAVATARSPARRRLASPLILGAVSVLVWLVPAAAPSLQRALAPVLALVAAGALADWLVTLSGSDPFSALRSLPLGVTPVWCSRFASALVFIVVLLAAHALAARGMSLDARIGMLAGMGVAVGAVAALGVNYGVTLFPRTDVARRLLALSLGMAVAASLMIPLAGWVLLLTGLLHSARRLPRWSRLEETT